MLLPYDHTCLNTHIHTYRHSQKHSYKYSLCLVPVELRKNLLNTVKHCSTLFNSLAIGYSLFVRSSFFACCFVIFVPFSSFLLNLFGSFCIYFRFISVEFWNRENFVIIMSFVWLCIPGHCVKFKSNGNDIRQTDKFLCELRYVVKMYVSIISYARRLMQKWLRNRKQNYPVKFRKCLNTIKVKLNTFLPSPFLTLSFHLWCAVCAV